MNRLRLPSLLICLTSAGLALAPPAQGESLAVRLMAPQAGSILRAGSTAELEWAPSEGFTGLADVEEWEAFLSFDGGATYPVRITPHLDRDLRRVRWQVPGVPTADARLLLRFGDEKRERYFEVPQRFSIAGDPGAEWAFALAGTAAAPGEPALPGHAGVVAWVEGSRRGGSLRQVVAPEQPTFRDRLCPQETLPNEAVLDSQEAPAPAVRRSAPGRSPLQRGNPLKAFAPTSLLSFDILLLTQRQNE
ncbi:MAG TPA: hypothetical protein VGX68_29135 [Thermoanaerobaculia bacterium]|jgi:hypothetical protein|nr:hypothetical protein [Thermoanaerobaculia bacterium]